MGENDWMVDEARPKASSVRDLFPPATRKPPHVHVAAALTLVLAMYAAVMSVPLCCTGAFVGPHILIPGVMHAVLAVILFSSWNGLQHQRRWSRWLLVVLPAFVALALSIAVLRGRMAGEIDAGSTVFFLIIALAFALIASNLASSAVQGWFTD
jgi:hypothetical protein